MDLHQRADAEARAMKLVRWTVRLRLDAMKRASATASTTRMHVQIPIEEHPA